MKTILYSMLGLQLFADAGTLVNATGNYVNAGTGATTSFSGKSDSITWINHKANIL